MISQTENKITGSWRTTVTQKYMTDGRAATWIDASGWPQLSSATPETTPHTYHTAAPTLSKATRTEPELHLLVREAKYRHIIGHSVVLIAGAAEQKC